MNKLRKLSLLVLIPIVVGVVMFIVGNTKGELEITKAGLLVLSIGTPVTITVLVAIGLIIMFVGKSDKFKQPNTQNLDCEVKDNQNEQDDNSQSERENEQAQLDDINTSYRYSSREKLAEYEMQQIINAGKMYSAKQKAPVILFIVFLFVDFALAPTFAVLGIFVGAIICAVLFVGSVLAAFIAMTVLAKRSMRAGNGDDKDREIFEGTVKGCVMSSMTTAKYGQIATARVNSVVYAVIITAGEKQYTAYSEKVYETGDSVKFCIVGKRLASIIHNNDSELSDESKELAENVEK
ncbi:MAG: hypothetical protein J1F69_02080 [Clostridiales bacterium]|nr:hypothetical protein [Clostridiales bacterium]